LRWGHRAYDLLLVRRKRANQSRIINLASAASGIDYFPVLSAGFFVKDEGSLRC
jgi:hypothetical protein